MRISVVLKWILSIILLLFIIALSLDSHTESQIVPVWCSTPLIIFVGIYFVLDGLLKKKWRQQIARAGTKTTGTIVNQRHSKYYTYLSVQYHLAGGQRVEVESKQNVIFDFGLTGMGMTEGRKVAIVCNPVMPSEVYFPESFTFQWYPIIEMILGTIIVFGSIFTVFI